MKTLLKSFEQVPRFSALSLEMQADSACIGT